jgi:putative heme d1 biosynthesis radical SAM protein NirJ2
MIISWNITKACNLKCRHCYRDAGKTDPDELSPEQAKQLLKEIAKSGFKILVLSGGEPLLRKDIYEIISCAGSLGLKPVLGSNGTLITKEIARKLKSIGLARIGISLDSVDAQIHDGFRQKTGAWDLAVQAMQVCKNEGLEFQVHTTVSKKNLHEIDKITNLAKDLGARAHHIFFLVPTGRAKEISGFEISPKDYEMLLINLLKKQRQVRLELKPVCAPQFIPLAQKLGMKTRFQRGCLAGISYCCILPNGDVHPCPYLPIKLDNVRKTQFSQIWKENEIFMRLRSLDYQGRCSDCLHKNSCGGCRARAYYKSSELMGEDPNCTLQDLASIKC